MSLLLKKDYKEKASYYVWFLGAQESNELRSDYIIRHLIPQFLKRSRDHEPLKVTLQISQKGLKIIQGSIKHQIPHDAITSSIVSNDIVACTLLLSNPTSKSPLHVHAYRCDSKMTAYTLHDHLQSLISKPENQRKLAELEIKLSRPIHRESPPHRRFESSLGGSDTGTSTRESECSEEHQGPSVSPTVDKSPVFNSLAQELKFKLKAKEGPLLLPPKDYDTICRSKGNLVAVDMRRCQNSDIVGSNKKSLQRNKQKSSNNNNNHNVPIRSGGKFEWDQHQRRDLDSSSDDDWKNNGERFARNFDSKLKMSPSPPIDSYKIPLKSSSCKSGRDFCSCRNCYSKANNVDVVKYEQQRRDDDNPLTRRRGNQYDKEGEFMKKNTSPTFDDFESGLMRQHSERYRKSAERNMTSHHQQYLVDERFERNQHRPPPRGAKIDQEHHNVKKISMKNFENARNAKFSDRNPYREPDSVFYHESIENMMKSPLLNNFANRKQYRGDEGVDDEQYRLRESARRKLQQHSPRQGDYEPENSRKSNHSAPESTLRKATPKERFMNAKEKFQAMAERNRYEAYDNHHTPVKDHRLLEKCPSDVCSDCSENSCEDSDCSKRNNLNFYRQSFLTKSLGNLTKAKGGYRHSVALPDMSYKYCNRVGLAAIDY